MSSKSTCIAAAALVTVTCAAEAGWIGNVSYYHVQGKTASGRNVAGVGSFNAAHRTLPFGSRIRITNLANNRSVVVTITDRGPFIHGRHIDVSARAARALGIRSVGVARVRMELVGAS
ncbi:septal ring lytic transglycosylase RlpA family protein [Methylocystis echinoides]|uniref:septal ring lytic transglycosylase RlpA family protein n=1 Tax=Methylocystis echinoides TaxID=29468 RepID=UPI00341F9852